MVKRTVVLGEAIATVLAKKAVKSVLGPLLLPYYVYREYERIMKEKLSEEQEVLTA